MFYVKRSEEKEEVDVSRETFGEKEREVFYIERSEEKGRSRCFT